MELLLSKNKNDILKDNITLTVDVNSLKEQKETLYALYGKCVTEEQQKNFKGIFNLLDIIEGYIEGSTDTLEALNQDNDACEGDTADSSDETEFLYWAEILRQKGLEIIYDKDGSISKRYCYPRIAKAINIIKANKIDNFKIVYNTNNRYGKSHGAFKIGQSSCNGSGNKYYVVWLEAI